jgi:hypothetical protein
MIHRDHTILHNSTGVPTASIVCIGCGLEVTRSMRDIRKGQDRYCTRRCSNLHRARDERGQYA